MTLSPASRMVGWVAVVAIFVLAAVEWLLAILRPENGFLGVLQIIAPHLAFLGLVLVPVGLIVHGRVWVVATVALLIVVIARFGGEWVSLPGNVAAAGASPLSVLTWNLEVDSRSGAETAAILADHPVDLVALQELQPAVARAIAADPRLTAQYPFRALHPEGRFFGLGLLSRYPITDDLYDLGRAEQQAAVIANGRPITIINAHPQRGGIDFLGDTRIPIGIASQSRNEELDTIRGRIDRAMASGNSVVLLGDMNTASSEPAHDRLVAGLRDVHTEVGQGPGFTWRASSLEFLGIGLIRIDDVVTSPDIDPVAIGETCPSVGDHCLVTATVVVPARP